MDNRDDDLLKLWQHRKQLAYQLRQHYSRRWRENWRWYRNEKQTRKIKGQQWRSNAQLPDAFRVIETMVPQHVLNMFRTNNWFSVIAPSMAGEAYQRIVKNILLVAWRRTQAFSKTIVGVKLANITGHVNPKVTWEVREGERLMIDLVPEVDYMGNLINASFQERTGTVIEHRGPQLTIPDLMKIWQDPTGDERWWIEAMHKSLEELKDTNNRFGGALYKNLDQLTVKMGIGPAGVINHGTGQSKQSNSFSLPSGQWLDEATFDEEIEGISETFKRDHDSIELWQCWGYVPKSVKNYASEEGANTTQWRLQVIANSSVIIRDEPCPTWNRRPPYINCPAIPIPHQIYGESVISMIGDLIDLRSFIENARRDTVLLEMFGTYAIDGRFDITGQDLFKMPGGAVRLMPQGSMFDGTIRDAIIPIPRQPVLPEAYTESMVKDRQIKDTSGIMEMYEGRNFSGRPTAFEVGQATTMGNARRDMQVFWWDENFLKPVLEGFFNNYQTRMTTPEIVEMAGEDAVPEGVAFTGLEYPVDIAVDTAKFGSIDAERLQGIAQFAGMFSQIPEVELAFRWQKIAKEALFRFGLEGRFERSEEEIAAIQAQRQQQALLEAALSGSADGSPQGRTSTPERR